VILQVLLVVAKGRQNAHGGSLRASIFCGFTSIVLVLSALARDDPPGERKGIEHQARASRILVVPRGNERILPRTIECSITFEMRRASWVFFRITLGQVGQRTWAGYGKSLPASRSAFIASKNFSAAGGKPKYGSRPSAALALARNQSW
jgi:hypothetical protein